MENSGLLLFVQPLEKFLKTTVGQDPLDRIERVTEFIMTPGVVNEILAGMACGHDLRSALAPRHYVMSARRDLPFTEEADRFLIFRIDFPCHKWQPPCKSHVRKSYRGTCLSAPHNNRMWTGGNGMGRDVPETRVVIHGGEFAQCIGIAGDRRG